MSSLLTTGGQPGAQAGSDSYDVPNDAGVIRVDVDNTTVAHTAVTRKRTASAQVVQRPDQHKRVLSTSAAAPDYGVGLKMYQDLQRPGERPPVDNPHRWIAKGESA